MFQLIIKQAGHGKTKQLIERINQSSQYSKGVCIAIQKQQPNLVGISNRVRLINSEEYSIDCFTAFYGFLSGLLASNYDIESIFIDDIFEICGKDFKALENFIHQISILNNRQDFSCICTIADTIENLPESFRKYL